MSQTMPLPCRLTLVGLSPVDRSLLEALFLKDPGRRPHHEVVNDLHRAEVIIANADDAQTVRDLQARRLPAPVLLIGDADAGTGWTLLSRPIRLHAVIEAVNRLKPLRREKVAHRQETRVVRADAPCQSGPSPLPGVARPFAATVAFASLEMPLEPGPGAYNGFDVTRPFEPTAAGRARLRPSRAGTSPAYDLVDEHSVLLWRDAREAALPCVPIPGSSGSAGPRVEPETLTPSPPSLMPDTFGPSSIFADAADPPTGPQALAAAESAQAILLVGGARVAKGSLRRALHEFGYRADYAPNGEVALGRLASQDYGFVFLDDPSLGDDTLVLCRALRRRSLAFGHHPRLVVIAREGSLFRRFFAWLAGCDAWMQKPLGKKKLRQYLLGKSSSRLAA